MRFSRQIGGAPSYHSLKSSPSISRILSDFFSKTFCYHLNLCDTLGEQAEERRRKSDEKQKQNGGLRLKAFSMIPFRCFGALQARCLLLVGVWCLGACMVKHSKSAEKSLDTKCRVRRIFRIRVIIRFCVSLFHILTHSMPNKN